MVEHIHYKMLRNLILHITYLISRLHSSMNKKIASLFEMISAIRGAHQQHPLSMNSGKLATHCCSDAQLRCLCVDARNPTVPGRTRPKDNRLCVRILQAPPPHTSKGDVRVCHACAVHHTSLRIEL